MILKIRDKVYKLEVECKKIPDKISVLIVRNNGKVLNPPMILNKHIRIIGECVV